MKGKYKFIAGATVLCIMGGAMALPEKICPVVYLGAGATESVTFKYGVLSDGSYEVRECITRSETVDRFNTATSSIGESSFEGCSTVRTIIIPDTVTNIGEYAFKNCTALENIEISGNVTEIKKGTFQGCTMLKEITIPSSVESIADGAFADCISLERIVISNPSCTIGDIPESTVIYGYENSTAQQYATDNNRSFALIGTQSAVTGNRPETFSLGDVNQSGMTDAVDATMVLMEYASLSTGGAGSFTETQKNLADVNFDGITDAVDATGILQYYSYVSTGGTDKAEVFFGRNTDTGNSGGIVTVLHGTTSNNISANDYSTWATTVKSYLFENSQRGLTRVEYMNNSVLVEEYAEDNSLAFSEKIDMPLPVFGGFYSGSNANYLVLGQNNKEESSDTEIMRVVKYSKDWQIIDSVSAYGCNTTVPFRAGSLRMTETNGRLYIHTCHEMYTYTDGLNHQANMTFVVDEETMEITDSHYSISNNGTGYVSHSFNQFIATDGSNIYRCDHGDAHPRGIMISKCSSSLTGVSHKNVFEISGTTGNNSTGVSAGGLALSENNCLVVGNSVDMEAENYSAYGQRNIFLSVTDKQFESTSYKYLTEYTGTDNVSTATPQIVKVSEEMFLIMWEENNNSGVCVKALTVDGNGNITQSAVTLNDARLSDCQSIVTADGLVKWYVSDSSSVRLYSIQPDNLAGTSAT